METQLLRGTAVRDAVLAELKAYKPGFTIAGNCGHNIGTDYVKRYEVDFHYSDNNFIPDPSRWWNASKAHRALGSALLLHPNVHMSKDVRRKLIALGYANGAHVITPWDEYIHGKARLFADPADFADLYGFARALGQQGYLNGYEDAAVGGYDLKETRYGNMPPIAVSGGSGKLSAFARAKPGQTGAPLVIHLAEWGKPAPAKVRLRSSGFFADSAITVSLQVPPEYEAGTHEKVEESKDYSPLSSETTLDTESEGDWLTVGVPALRPWGVLVVSRSTE